MSGLRQEHGCTIGDQTAASGRRSGSLRVRLGVLISLALTAAMACAGNASAVTVEGPGGKKIIYEPLAGALHAPPAGAVPQAAPNIRLASPALECYPDLANDNCATAAENEPLVAGSQVMNSTTSYFIYWDPKGAAAFPAGYESGITTYFKGLAKDNGSDQNQYSILTQYYSDLSSAHVRYETHFGKALNDKDTYPAEPGGTECAGKLTTPCIDDAQIAAEIEHLIATHKLAPSFKPGGDAAGEEAHVAYFVLLPPGVSVCSAKTGCSRVQFCAYHSYNFSVSEFSNPNYVGPEAYAVLPYVADFTECASTQHPNGISDGALSGGIVHEFAEMITDPLGTGWINQETGGEEVADICNSEYWAGYNKTNHEKMHYGTPLGTAPNGALYNQVVGGRDYYLTQLWSNEAGGCRQRMGLPPTVTRLAPAKGSIAGGKKVKITGLNFENPNVTGVSFGKLAAKEFTVTSPTSITAVSPASTITGVVEVKLTSAAGTNASSTADQYTYE